MPASGILSIMMLMKSHKDRTEAEEKQNMFQEITHVKKNNICGLFLLYLLLENDVSYVYNKV